MCCGSSTSHVSRSEDNYKHKDNERDRAPVHGIGNSNNGLLESVATVII